jgi:Uncharacterized conserved protein
MSTFDLKLLLLSFSYQVGQICTRYHQCMYLYQQSALDTQDGSVLRIQDMIIRVSENKIHLQKINSKLVQNEFVEQHNIVSAKYSLLCCLETFQLLERAQEENRRLLSLLEERDRKIFALESRIYQLQREMSQEKDRLREENAALIRAMASLATAK